MSYAGVESEDDYQARRAGERRRIAYEISPEGRAAAAQKKFDEQVREWIDIERMKSGEPPLYSESGYRLDQFTGAGGTWRITHVKDGWVANAPTRAEAWKKMGTIMEKIQINWVNWQS